MFNVSGTELFVIVVVALLVVGPKEIPSLLRTVARTLGQVRRTTRDFQTAFNDVLKEAERQAGLDEVRRDLRASGTGGPAKPRLVAPDGAGAAGPADGAPPEPPGQAEDLPPATDARRAVSGGR
ncbi:Sec-independent protein translocase protein TatB [Acuticoccus kandeliae]|uniref:Sec-independent protein translocase protein TatB n=1 Tax=Acuticoccus kandeliae TaxID=2073160 RepID=UPI000D3E6E78|nr:Sec-independent protein translocase protein TatB [Acuticoccus kandeliae]